MSIARKMRREKQIQARKALRHELKDQAVQDFIKDQVRRGGYENYMAGVKAGKDIIIHAADHLEYTV